MNVTEWEQLLARDACRDLVMRSALHVDAREPAAYAALYAPDGSLQRPGGEPMQGRAAIEAAYAARPASRISRHQITTCLITLDGADRATGISYVQMWSGDAAEADSVQGRPAHARQLAGAFEDCFVRTVEGWRIQTRKAYFSLYRD